MLNCSDTVQKRLPDLTLLKAIRIAQGTESADWNAKALKGTETVVQKFTTSKPTSWFTVGRQIMACANANSRMPSVINVEKLGTSPPEQSSQEVTTQS